MGSRWHGNVSTGCANGSPTSCTTPTRAATQAAEGGRRDWSESLTVDGLNYPQGARGDIDTTYHTQQRDMFASGLASDIGVYAYSVWNAIKSHSDFNTGDSWPGIRRLCALTGISDQKVQESIKTLQTWYLLRVVKKPGKSNHYIARERMDVRVGGRVICTVVVDYIPSQMRERLERLKGAAKGEIDKADVWAHVELIPGRGMKLDAQSGSFKTQMRADEVSSQILQVNSPVGSTAEVRKKLKLGMV